METKLYALVCNIGYTGSRITKCVFKSEEDARFRAWELNRDTDSWHMARYSVEEIPLTTIIPDPKQWKKYREERLKEIESEIAAKESCAQSDEAGITKLRAERDKLTTP